ncbi:MAG: hypothetical protein E7437_03380 [Ruminococcaceae bacterium]|nr:hypothetical protein [Oscillospiraceae bacterium]
MPVETTLETEPETNLVTVTDAYIDARKVGTNTMCYHIPRINMPGDLASGVNEKIYQELSGSLARYPYDENGFYIMDMTYVWGQRGDILSILVEEDFSEGDYVTYYTYHVSTVTGQEVSVEEVYNVFGITEADYYSTVKTVAENYYDRSGMLEYTPVEIVQQTFTDLNIANSKPAIGKNGELVFSLMIYTPAGSGESTMLFSADGNDMRGYTDCQVHY